jgi:glycogen debranching enzyme
MSELELERHPNDATKKRDERLSDEEKEERKLHVNSSHIASLAGSIANSLAVKDENVYFVSQPDSRVPLEGYHGYGLFFNDCRYLNGYELKIAGEYPNVLVASDEHGYMDLFKLANPALDLSDDHHLAGETIGIRIVRTIDGERQTMHEAIRFQNYSLEALEIPITLSFKAEFEDIFAVRGLLQERFGELHSPEWSDDVLNFSYEGADGLHRGLRVYFDPAPERTEETTAHFTLKLQPRETLQLMVSFVVAEAPTREEALQDSYHARDPDEMERVLKKASDEWLEGFTQVQSDNWMLNRLLQRSIRDLRVLRSNLQGQRYFVAGLPWFGTLFGRDAAITALQMLAYDPSIAEQSLRLLVNYQADETDWWRDANPGKFLHELRIGEMARIGEIPHYPYFGTVDATPLFLVLVARHAAWTGDLTLFEELRENIDAAFKWIDEYGDLDDDGYIEYDTKVTETRAGKRLINQGWKDSGDALINEDGSLADPPIAVIEAQGYVYQAKMEMSELYRRAGETERADQLVREAEALRERFNEDFWLEDLGFYALALQADNKPCAVVTSNPGHALWSGIIDPERAEQVVERLMADDMFSGWGIRTLSKDARAYNPLSYHRGTVWPWDNAIVAAGFYHYGFDEAAARVFNGMVDAARRFEDHRLPELFGGYDRDEYQIPVRYPVACHPQAWSAGTLPFLLQCLLGLQPDAFENKLRIVRPYLPDMCDRLEMKGLRVGSAMLDLRFERTEHGVAVQVLDQEGDLEVIVEPSRTS